MRTRTFLFLCALALIGGVSFALWRGLGPLPDPEGCSAAVDGRTVSLELDQAENATLIAAIGIQRGLPARAVSIALATAYQESKIRNLAHGDRDSLGIFQQRPSQGWGSAAQIRNPVYAINAFYDALEKVDGYQTMRITEAAQAVQRSGFPEAYEDHAPDARALASALTGYSDGGAFTCVVHAADDRVAEAAVRKTLRQGYGTLEVSRTGARRDLAVTVATDDAGHRLGWSVAQFLVGHAKTLKLREVSFDGLHWRNGRDSEKGWVSGGTGTPTQVTLSLG